MDLMNSSVLEGVNVGITGTAAVSGKLSDGLAALGAHPVIMEESVIDRLVVDFDFSLLEAGNCLLVFTSGNGVRVFFSLLEEKGIDVRSLSKCRFAAIGSATSRVLREYGRNADICPEIFTGKALAQAIIAGHIGGERVLLFRSAMGDPALKTDIEDAGIEVEDIHTYTVHSDSRIVEAAAKQLDSLNYLCFASAGSVKLFLQEYGSFPQNAKCVCIGETTANALHKVYDRDFILSEEISAESMIEAIITAEKQK